tara:strand:+ start:647 stop:886 length:240 start_codon:yes stop_codon:yes gene_type:complete
MNKSTVTKFKEELIQLMEKHNVELNINTKEDHGSYSVVFEATQLVDLNNSLSPIIDNASLIPRNHQWSEVTAELIKSTI